MGSLNTALRVTNFMERNPGKVLRIKSIAKATGASPVGVAGILRREAKGHMPLVEGRIGKEITFQLAKGEPGVSSGEVTLNLPTTNGHAVTLTMAQGRKVYSQLKALFEPKA